MAQLREFYRAVNRNVKRHYSKRDAWFRHDEGLCLNIKEWCVYNGFSYKEYRRLKDRMLDQFTSHGLSRIVPFNHPDLPVRYPYINECNMNRCYENPYRLEWIRRYSA